MKDSILKFRDDIKDASRTSLAEIVEADSVLMATLLYVEGSEAVKRAIERFPAKSPYGNAARQAQEMIVDYDAFSDTLFDGGFDDALNLVLKVLEGDNSRYAIRLMPVLSKFRNKASELMLGDKTIAIDNAKKRAIEKYGFFVDRVEAGHIKVNILGGGVYVQ